MKKNSFSVAALNFLITYFKRKGIDTEPIIRKLDLDIDLLSDPESRIPISKIQTLWKEGVDFSGDATLPLQLGCEVNPFSIGVISYMLMHCQTLGEAFEKLGKYQDVACEGILTIIKTEEDRCFLQLIITDEEITFLPYAIESELSVYLSLIQAMLGYNLPIEEVHFTYPTTHYLHHYEKIFGTQKVLFNSSFNGIVFYKSYLQAPILNANPALFPFFENHVKNSYDNLKNTDTLTYKIKQQILEYLKGEEPKLRAIARNIGMSTRSIQMKLKEEGTGFRKILDEIRKEIAISHMKEGIISTTDLSFLLGFSEPSVFHRSFKKWTGETPSSYRRGKAVASI